MNTENQKTILLVEDEAIIAMTEKMTIEKYGYEVISANTGEEAVALVEKSPAIDLILMDINLGTGIDGTEAAEIILRDHDIPIVFLSSHTEPEIVARTEKITAYGFIVKNSSETVFPALLKMVFKLFESKKKEREKEPQKDSALKALRVSEARTMALLSAIPDMLFRVDRQGVFLDYKADIKDLYAQSEPNLIGKRLRDMVPAAFADLINRKTRATLETGALQTFEYRLPVPGRGERDYEARMAASGADEVTAIIRDITERKQVEASLQKSELQLKAMMDSSPVVILLIQEGKLIYVNHAAKKITGWQEEEFIGKIFTSFVHKDDIELVIKNNRERMGGNSFLAPYVLRINKKTGGFIYTEVNGTVIDLDGKPTMLGFLTDITERKRAEQELRESKALIDAVVENVPLMIFLKEATDLRFVVFNRAGEELLGYDRENLLGKNNLDLFPPEQAAHFQAKDREVLEGKAGILDIPEEPILTAKKGTRLLHTRKICIRGADGTTKYLLGISEDITERKHAEDEIQQQLAEKEILLKEVHHRIKNNIASIAGLISLRLQSVTNPEAAAVLKDAIGRVDSMRILYDKMLLSQGYKDISVKRYLDDLIDTIIAMFPEKEKITIRKQIADFPLDPKRLFPLGSIINELLTNIMKYAFRDLDTGLIKISLAHTGNHGTLTIHDNGVGLPDGFDIKESKGFGLTLVKMLSQQLGGSFAIKSDNGTRSTLEFDI